MKVDQYITSFLLGILGVLNLSLAQIDGQGWTLLEPSENSQLIYVSSSEGDDGNNGLSPETPLATINAGFEMLRSGSPDHLLLKRGDTWSLSTGFFWNKGGSSENEPLVLGSYGASDVRPRIDFGLQGGMVVTPGYRSASIIEHVAITDLHIYSSARDPQHPNFDSTNLGDGTGILIIGVENTGEYTARNILIENCMVEFMTGGIQVSAREATPVSNLKVRRNIIRDIFGSNTSQGMLWNYVFGGLVEENIIDRIIYYQVPSAIPNFLVHSFYVQVGNRDIEIRNNIITRSPDSPMMRSGGVFEGNFVGEVETKTIGHLFGGSPAVEGGVYTLVRDNVFQNAGWVTIGNVNEGLVQNNLFSDPDLDRPYLLLAANDDNNMGNMGVHNLSITNNVLNNRSEWLSVSGSQNDPAWYSNVTLENNTVNVPDTIGVALESYAAFIGGEGTLPSFMEEAHLQSRWNWRNEYTAQAINAYILSAYGLDVPTTLVWRLPNLKSSRSFRSVENTFDLKGRNVPKVYPVHQSLKGFFVTPQ